MQSKLILTALLGASFAFAGCSAADKAKDAAASTADKAKDAASATADKAKDAAAATADKAKAGVETAAAKTGDLASDAKAAANDAGGSAKTYGDKAAAKVDEAAGSGKTYGDKAAAKADEAAGSGKTYADGKKKKLAALSSGTFSGRSDHITTGGIHLVKTPKGYRLNFAPDFSLDGAPDPIVALGNGGVYDKANKIGHLKAKEGRQSYALPASFTPGEFSQVYIWCEKFDVPLGIADLADNKS